MLHSQYATTVHLYQVEVCTECSPHKHQIASQISLQDKVPNVIACAHHVQHLSDSCALCSMLHPVQVPSPTKK